MTFQKNQNLKDESTHFILTFKKSFLFYLQINMLIYNKMVGINFILNVLIQVFAIFVFLSIFFFTYAAKKEGDVVKNQVNFLVDSFVGNNLNLLPDDIKELIRSKINSIKTDSPENLKINKEIQDSNEKIKNKTIDVCKKIGIALGAIIIISLVLSKKVNYFKKLNLTKIFKETVVILIAVGLTEFLFLTYLGAQFISIDPNIVKAKVFENLSKAFKL